MANPVHRLPQAAPYLQIVIPSCNGTLLLQGGFCISLTAKKVWDWVKKHADLIKKIGDVLSTVSDVLSVVAAVTAEIPIVGEITSAAAMATSGAALATHGLAKAAGADVSAMDLAGDAAGLIPFGAGKAAMTGTKALTKDAGKAAVKGAKEAKGAAKLKSGIKSGREELTQHPHGNPKEIAKSIHQRGVDKFKGDYNHGQELADKGMKALGHHPPDNPSAWSGAAKGAIGHGALQARDSAVSSGLDQASDAVFGNDHGDNENFAESQAEGGAKDYAKGQIGDKLDDGAEKVLDKAIERRG